MHGKQIWTDLPYFRVSLQTPAPPHPTPPPLGHCPPPSWKCLCVSDADCANLQDPVPRVGKLGVLYSRPGKRVLVDQEGDMQVRPTPLDIRLSSANPGLRHNLPPPPRPPPKPSHAQRTGVPPTVRS